MSMITELVERLRKNSALLEITFSTAENLREAADVIEELSTKLQAANMERSSQYYNGGWIPVSERLPRKGEYGKVLVTYIPSGGTLWTTVMIAHYSDLMGIAKPSFHIGEVGKESFQNITEQVTAWMPLPEPFEGNTK